MVAGELVVSLNEHRLSLVPTIVLRSAECLCGCCCDCKLGVGVFFGLRDVLHGVVYNGEGVDLRKQILAIVIGTHNEGEP